MPPPFSRSSFLLVLVLFLTSTAKSALGFSGFGWEHTAGGCDVQRLPSSSLFNANTDADGGPDRPRRTMDLLEVEDEETKLAREIADSVERAKTAISSAATDTGTGKGPGRADTNKAASGVATVLDRTKEEVDELKFKIGKVDRDRVKELEAKEAEISRLKFSLMDLKEKAAESERRAKDADLKIKALQKEGEGTKEENKNIVAKIRDQFKKEKDDMSVQLSSIADELRQARLDASKEISFIKLASSEKEEQLQSEIAELESTLKETEASLAKSVEETSTMRERHREELAKQMSEAKRLQEASDRIAGQDKRALRNKAWELQTALDEAKFEVMQTSKLAERIEAERETLEKRLEDMEKSATQQILDMEEEVKSIRYVLASQIAALRAAAEKEKATAQKAKIVAIANVKKEKWEAMDLAKVKYDALVVLNRQRLKEAEEKAEQRIGSVRDVMEARLEGAKKAAEREKMELKERQEVQMLVLRTEADQRIKAVQKTLSEVEDDLTRKAVAIDTYEKERKSFRKLARLTWKLTRERSSKLRQRMARKLLRRRR